MGGGGGGREGARQCGVTCSYEQITPVFFTTNLWT